MYCRHQDIIFDKMGVWVGSGGGGGVMKMGRQQQQRGVLRLVGILDVISHARGFLSGKDVIARAAGGVPAALLLIVLFLSPSILKAVSMVSIHGARGAKLNF